MESRVTDLKKELMETEEQHRDAYRRAVWLERRLYAAPTDAEFDRLSAELKQQEQQLQKLGEAVACARYKYTGATMGL